MKTASKILMGILLLGLAYNVSHSPQATDTTDAIVETIGLDAPAGVFDSVTYVVDCAIEVAPVLLFALALLLDLFFPIGFSSLVGMDALDLTELKNKLGDYFRKHKQFLQQETLLGMDISDRMEIWDDIQDECPLPQLTTEDLVHPADPSGGFNPTAGALKFDARTLKVRDWQVDLTIVPRQLHKTWLGMFKTKKGNDPFDLPLEAFIMQSIVNRIKDNLRRKSLFQAVHAPFPGGTTPLDVWDGYLKIITDAIAALELTPTITGVVTLTNIIDSVEAVYDNLDEAHKNERTQVLVSPTLYDFYNRRYRALHGQNANYVGMSQDMLTIDGTSSILKREPGLAGSQRIIATRPENMVYGVDSLSDNTNMRFEVENRTIKVMVDSAGGVQMKEVNDDAVAVNDQA